MISANSAVATRFLTFWADGQLYALPATSVSEVVRLAAVARVPQGPAALLGVANLRGTVVPVVGLRELLRKPPSADATEKLALILEQATPTALVVDLADTLETVTAAQVETSPQALDTQGAEKLAGAFKIARTQQIAKLLDIDALLATSFAQFAGGQRAARPQAYVPKSVAHQIHVDALEMLVTFEVAGQEFALPLADVEEILPVPASVTTMTQSDAVILGFTAVRNSLIPLLSLRGLLGFESQVAATQGEKVVVLKVAGSPVGLVVDAARSVVSAELAAIEAVPAVLAARTGGESKIRAVYRGNRGQRLISILSPDQLFREDVMQRLAALKPKENVTQTSSTRAQAKQERIFLVFRLGEDEFGLPIDTVVEVAPVPPQITRVPKTPKFLDGVVNLRGDVLPVVDQRRRFDMPALEATEGRRLVVVKAENHQAGIIVDSVSEVLRVSPDTISPYPDLTGHKSRLVHSVINLAEINRLVLLLDSNELLTRTEQSQLEDFQQQRSKARV